jgi:hypothetical protein
MRMCGEQQKKKKILTDSSGVIIFKTFNAGVITKTDFRLERIKMREDDAGMMRSEAFPSYDNETNTLAHTKFLY